MPNMFMLVRDIRLSSEVTVRIPNDHKTLECYGSLRFKIAKPLKITCEHLKTGMQRQQEHYYMTLHRYRG